MVADRWEMYPGHHGHWQDGSRRLDGHRMLAPCCYQGRWHLVVTKVTDSLHDAPLFLLSLNFNETAVVGDVIVSVVELLHQLALVTTEELIEHLANQLRLPCVDHELSSAENCYLCSAVQNSQMCL